MSSDLTDLPVTDVGKSTTGQLESGPHLETDKAVRISNSTDHEHEIARLQASQPRPAKNRKISSRSELWRSRSSESRTSSAGTTAASLTSVKTERKAVKVLGTMFGHVRDQLGFLLLYEPRDGLVSELQVRRGRLQVVSLARVRFQHAQPHHIHDIQQGFQTNLRQAAHLFQMLDSVFRFHQTTAEVTGRIGTDKFHFRISNAFSISSERQNKQRISKVCTKQICRK